VWHILNKLPFKGKLLVCDMDGTLLNSSSRVSPENKDALDRFVKGGGLFTVATGRMDKTVKPYLEHLPVNVPAIVYNGAAIIDFNTDEILWQDCLSESAYDIGVKLIERFPEAGLQIYNGGRIYYVRQNEETYEHLLRENFDPVICGIEGVPQPWMKLLIAWKPERLKEVEEFLSGVSKSFHSVFSEPQFIELLNLGVSKGSALKKLTAILGDRCELVVGMGDNLNDIELIKEATFGIAVGNAHESLKSIAYRCCGTNDSHAVAEVIGWLEDGTIGL
jgi:Cof subfamily protein (haloacid dehalogenase superfamily)